VENHLKRRSSPLTNEHQNLVTEIAETEDQMIPTEPARQEKARSMQNVELEYSNLNFKDKS